MAYQDEFFTHVWNHIAGTIPVNHFFFRFCWYMARMAFS